MHDTAVRELHVSTYRVPTEQPEAEGTATWDATELVVVQPVAGDHTGLGWSYCAAPAGARVIADLLRPVVLGSDALDVPGSWQAMHQAVRNAGAPGLVSMAIAAVDLALWDLKAKLLGLPLNRLLGRCRDTVPVYGSGGFVSLTDTQLTAQLRHRTDDVGIGQVKIKVGERWGQAPDRDLERTRRTCAVVGNDVEVFVDANGGYTPGQARRLGRAYDDLGVTWFEEPLSSDDLDGLALLREHLQSGTWSTSPTTPASSRCSSTAFPTCRPANCCPATAPATAWPSPAALSSTAAPETTVSTDTPSLAQRQHRA